MYDGYTCHALWIYFYNETAVRVGNGTVPLAMVIYIDGCFIKDIIAVLSNLHH